MSLKERLNAGKAAKQQRKLVKSVERLQQAQAMKSFNKSLTHGLPSRIQQAIGSTFLQTIYDETVRNAQLLAFAKPTERDQLDSYGKLLALARLAASALLRFNPKDRVLKQLVAALLLGTETWRYLERQYIANGAVLCSEAYKNSLEVTTEAILAVFDRATERLIVECWRRLNEGVVRELLGFDSQTGQIKEEDSEEFDKLIASKGG